MVTKKLDRAIICDDNWFELIAQVKTNMQKYAKLCKSMQSCAKICNVHFLYNEVKK